MSNEKFRCVSPFAIFPNEKVRVYGGGAEVDADDPILETHRVHFAPVALSATEAVAVEAVRTETATAAPGDLRSITTPVKRGPGRSRKNPKPVVPAEPPATVDPEPVVESSVTDATED